MSLYLDHAATSPLRPEAREAMLPYLGEILGMGGSIFDELKAVST